MANEKRGFIPLTERDSRRLASKTPKPERSWTAIVALLVSLAAFISTNLSSCSQQRELLRNAIVESGEVALDIQREKEAVTELQMKRLSREGARLTQEERSKRFEVILAEHNDLANINAILHKADQLQKELRSVWSWLHSAEWLQEQRSEIEFHMRLEKYQIEAEKERVGMVESLIERDDAATSELEAAITYAKKGEARGRPGPVHSPKQ